MQQQTDVVGTTLVILAQLPFTLIIPEKPNIVPSKWLNIKYFRICTVPLMTLLDIDTLQKLIRLFSKSLLDS